MNMNAVPQRRSRSSAAVFALLGAALVMLLVTPARSAFAHARLLSSDPAGGATVAQTPQRVTLTFSEPIESDFAQVQVTGPDGVRVDAGAPEVAGDVVAVPLQPLSQSGAYNVAFRVVSADGHPVEASFAFTLSDAAVAPPPSPSLSTNQEASASPSTTPAPASRSRGSSPAAGVALTLAAAVLLAAGVYALVRHRQQSERNLNEQ
jgi:copper resistance protein C